MHSSGPMRLDLGECLLFNGGNDHFETLGAGSAKTLDTPPMVEIAPRPLTKAVTASNEEEPPQIAAE